MQFLEIADDDLRFDSGIGPLRVAIDVVGDSKQLGLDRAGGGGIMRSREGKGRMMRYYEMRKERENLTRSGGGRRRKMGDG
jgi:hypothetical protein